MPCVLVPLQRLLEFSEIHSRVRGRRPDDRQRVHRPRCESRRRILQVARRRRLPLRRLKFTFPFRLQFSAPPAAAENADGATTGIVQRGEERRGTEGGRWVSRAGAVPAAAAACKFQRLLRKSAPSGIKTDGDAHYKVVALRKQCYFTNQSTFSRWVSEIGYFEKKRWRQIRHQVCPSCAAPHAVCAQGY